MSKGLTAPRWLWPVLLPAGLTVLAVVVLCLGLDTAKDTFERDLMVLVAGAVIGGAGSLAGRWLSRRDEYRKGAYTERARAVQAVLQSARVVKDQALKVWQTRNEKGIDEFSPRELLERRATELGNEALVHDVWIGERGVNAVRAFIDALSAEKIRAAQDPAPVLDSAMLDLKAALMKDLGFKPE